MRRGGYSPKGYRPEPTEAPPTPPPISPAVDAFADLRFRLTVLVNFVSARLAEDGGSAMFERSLGYAQGYAEACLDCGDIVGAVRKVEWLRKEATARWADHPDYPAAERAQ